MNLEFAKITKNKSGSGEGSTLKALLDYTKSTMHMFYWNQSIVDVTDYIQFNDTSEVKNMSDMFYKCTSLTNVPLFDTSKAINMSGMFQECALTSVPEYDTSNAVNTGSMFASCTKLTSVPKFNTSNATKMSKMFYSCTGLTSVPELDTSKCTDMNSIFQNCTGLTSIPELDTSVCTNMSYMFSGCTNLTTIPKLDLMNCTNTYNMFYNCTNLTNVTLLNIKTALTIGSGTSYGQLLTADSLINCAFECINTGSNKKLTIGSTHGDKLNGVYVKFTDSSVTTIPTGEKGDVVLCESTDEGAMTLYAYMNLKNWGFASGS